MLETIKINKNEYPFTFGFNAMRKFIEETGLTTATFEYEIASKLNYTLLAIYIGVQEGKRQQGEQFEMPIAEFVDLFDTNTGTAEMLKALKLMQKQMRMVVSNDDNKATKSKNVKAPKK